MAKVTKRQIEYQNSVSFTQLINEIKQDYEEVEDIYYSDHLGVWVINYKDGNYEKCDDFRGILFDILSIK